MFFIETKQGLNMKTIILMAILGLSASACSTSNNVAWIVPPTPELMEQEYCDDGLGSRIPTEYINDADTVELFCNYFAESADMAGR